VSNDPQSPPAGRAGYFCVPKALRDQVRNHFDGAAETASALAVLDALCEIANDKNSPRFVSDQPYIAGRAGCSVRTLGDRLNDLKAIGLIHVETPPLRGPSTYEIPALRDVPPFGNSRGTFGDNCGAFGNGRIRASLPTTKEHQKNNRTKTEEGDSASLLASAPVEKDSKASKPDLRPSLEHWLAYADTLNWPRGDAEAAFDHYEANGWRQSNGNVIRDWKAAARNCHRRARTSGNVQSRSTSNLPEL
jgi:hypothetical protein